MVETAKVFITGPTGITKLARCILDGGSQSSFLSSRLVDILNLKVISTENLEVRGFESYPSETHPRRNVQLKLSSVWNKSSVSLSAFESPNTYAPQQTVPMDITLYARQRNLKLADPYDETNNLPIEVLIGADFYWSVMSVKPPIKLSENLVLMPSKLGWIVSGNRSNAKVNRLAEQCTFSGHIVIQDSNAQLIKQVDKFWKLQSAVINDEFETENRSSTTLLLDAENSHTLLDSCENEETEQGTESPEYTLAKAQWRPKWPENLDDSEISLETYLSVQSENSSKITQDADLSVQNETDPIVQNDADSIVQNEIDPSVQNDEDPSALSETGQNIENGTYPSVQNNTDQKGKEDMDQTDNERSSKLSIESTDYSEMIDELDKDTEKESWEDKATTFQGMKRELAIWGFLSNSEAQRFECKRESTC